MKGSSQQQSQSCWTDSFNLANRKVYRVEVLSFDINYFRKAAVTGYSLLFVESSNIAFKC